MPFPAAIPPGPLGGEFCGGFRRKGGQSASIAVNGREDAGRGVPAVFRERLPARPRSMDFAKRHGLGGDWSVIRSPETGVDGRAAMKWWDIGLCRLSIVAEIRP